MSQIRLIPLLAKTLVFFLIINLIFLAAGDFSSAIGQVSAYNSVFPGRLRFPFGENPREAYNLSLYNVEAMFSAHEISAGEIDKKPSADVYRVFLLGDSSVWGTLLKPQETLAGQLNAMNLTCEGKAVHVFNLGYPTISITKDLMILDEAMAYHPDRILWLTTLEAMPMERQLDSPIAANNPKRILALAEKYDLVVDSSRLSQAAWYERTLVGQRRALADIFRLQAYGVMWAATGIDQAYPDTYPAAQRDFEAVDMEYQGWQPSELPVNQLALDVLKAGVHAAGEIPLLIVNEPIMVSSGIGSEARYNFFYPRWAYDDYRTWLTAQAQENNWDLLDLWNIVPEDEFTNSAIHLTPEGTNLLAETLSGSICALP